MLISLNFIWLEAFYGQWSEVLLRMCHILQITEKNKVNYIDLVFRYLYGRYILSHLFICTLMSCLLAQLVTDTLLIPLL